MYKPFAQLHLFGMAAALSALNCIRCGHTHHTHDIHTDSNDSLLKVGKCLVPGCECAQYVDKIETIDEDLL